jgi:uncharacterized OB-fold protein
VRSGAPTAVKPRLPITIAIVRLDEGVRMLANILPGAAELKIDARVEFRPQTVDGRLLPAFRVVAV